MPSSSTRHSRSSAALMALAIVAGVALSPRATRATSVAGSEYAVIVSNGVAVDGLSLDELRRIFLFKRTVWRPGQTINVLLPDTGTATRAFLLRDIYRMSEGELRRFILERIFQAEIDLAPKVVGSRSCSRSTSARKSGDRASDRKTSARP